MKTVKKYVADDGAEFDTAAAAKAHEQRGNVSLLVGMTADQVNAAMSLEDGRLSDAIETAAYAIQKARLARGITKRPSKPRGAKPAAPASPAIPDEAPAKPARTKSAA